jgi:hypothetical protein
MIHERHRLP